jgi:hypothetical protein
MDAAVPTKIMIYAAGLLTRLISGAFFKYIPTSKDTKPKINPIIVEFFMIHPSICKD